MTSASVTNNVVNLIGSYKILVYCGLKKAYSREKGGYSCRIRRRLDDKQKTMNCMCTFAVFYKENSKQGIEELKLMLCYMFYGK